MARYSFSDSDNITASEDELRKLTLKAKEDFLFSVNNDVDIRDTKQLINAISLYFDGCFECGTRPGNMGLYRALGLSRQDVNHILAGKAENRVTPEGKDILKKALRIIAEYREQLGAQGKINPVSLIFWQKNYDGLTDTQQLQVNHSNALLPDMTPEQIARRIEKDIPIDALEGEYKEIETEKDV